VAYRPEPDLAMVSINPTAIINKYRPIDGQKATDLSDQEIPETPIHDYNHSGTELWRNRLGHPSFDLLQKTAKVTKGIPEKSLREKDLHCEACITGKFIR
jgi:hypothetical protein